MQGRTGQDNFVQLLSFFHPWDLLPLHQEQSFSGTHTLSKQENCFRYKKALALVKKKPIIMNTAIRTAGVRECISRGKEPQRLIWEYVPCKVQLTLDIPEPLVNRTKSSTHIQKSSVVPGPGSETECGMDLVLLGVTAKLQAVCRIAVVQWKIWTITSPAFRHQPNNVTA